MKQTDNYGGEGERKSFQSKFVAQKLIFNRKFFYFFLLFDISVPETIRKVFFFKQTNKETNKILKKYIKKETRKIIK